MRLAQLVDLSASLAGAAGLQAVEIDPALASAEKVQASGSLRCVAQTFANASTEVRMVLIESAKIQVISCFVYPQPELALPLYAMELVQLGAKPIVAVIDAVVPAGDPAGDWTQTWLKQAHAAVPHWINASDPPDWFAECRSGLDFFLRPASAEALLQAGVMHVNLFASYLNHALAAGSRDSQQAHAFSQFARHYKDHHAANSPGLPLMTKSFGPEWTDRFMQQCFFK